MATVSQIIAGCSQDIRRILDSADSGDQVALIDYTNRTQLQLLRAARWRFLLSNVLKFQTKAGVTDYWIGATAGNPTQSYVLSAAASNGSTTTYTGIALNTLYPQETVTTSGFVNGANNGTFTVQSSTATTATVNNPSGVNEAHSRTLSFVVTDTTLNITNLGIVKRGTVFDRTNSRRLYPTDEAPLGPNFTGLNRPELYRNDGTNTPGIFSVYPPPQDVYVIEFRYYFSKPQLSALSDTLLIPDDYKDVVIAGVNYFASLYLRENYNDAQIWKRLAK